MTRRAVLQIGLTTTFNAIGIGAKRHSHRARKIRRDGHDIDVDVGSAMASTATEFQLDIRLVVQLDGAPFFERRTSESIPRDLV